MRFKRHHTPWNKNKKNVYSKKMLMVLSEKKKGNQNAKGRKGNNGNGFKKGGTPWNKGLIKETDERVKSMAEKRSGEGNPMFGKTLSDDHKAVLLKANLGKPLSKDHKLNASKGMIGNKNSLGHIHNRETRDKIKEKRKYQTLPLKNTKPERFLPDSVLSKYHGIVENLFTTMDNVYEKNQPSDKIKKQLDKSREDDLDKFLRKIRKNHMKNISGDI